MLLVWPLDEGFPVLYREVGRCLGVSVPSGYNIFVDDFMKLIEVWTKPLSRLFTGILKLNNRPITEDKTSAFRSRDQLRFELLVELRVLPVCVLHKG